MFVLNSDHEKKILLKGQFGLEMESLRIDQQGYLVHTEHPFQHHPQIVKDFSENQTEINTTVENSPKEAIEALYKQYGIAQKKLKYRDKRELLWPFSNPPYIRNEKDIPIAHFSGSEKSKKEYRQYLAERYGKYKMAFSGIHVNFSYEEELLKTLFEKSKEKEYQNFKNKLYLDLAAKMSVYGWILVAVTAASPIMDSSYMEKGKVGNDSFLGLASVRCSELGYWNNFSPIFDYTNINSYTDSIYNYVKKKMILAPSELYYPVRLKPKGDNDLSNLKKRGVNHIELRMFDLNPLSRYGIDERDIIFAHLLMVWLSTMPDISLNEADQIQAIQNFKNAAHFDLKTVRITFPNEESCSVVDAGLKIIANMKEFYKGYSREVQSVLEFQKNKFIDAENRYAWIIRKEFSNGYVEKGLKLALQKQEESNV